MPTLSFRRLMRKLRRDATVKESVDDVADQFVARSLHGLQNVNIEGIVEAIDRRQIQLEALHSTLFRYALFIFLILFVSTLPTTQQAAEISILGLSLKQDTILKFRVLLLLVGSVCGIAGALSMFSQRNLAAIQRALLRALYPSDAVNLVSHKYSMDGGIPYVGDLAFFEQQPMHNKWRPVLSHLFLAMSFFVILVCLIGTGFYIQFQILADLYNRPSGPGWLTYCAIGIVVVSDLSLLFFLIDTNRKRRIVYSAELQSRMDQWLEESRKDRRAQIETTLAKLSSSPKRLAAYRRKLTKAGIDPDNPN